jgi:hypothetical protein
MVQVGSNDIKPRDRTWSHEERQYSREKWTRFGLGITIGRHEPRTSRRSCKYTVEIQSRHHQVDKRKSPEPKKSKLAIRHG